VSIRKTRYPELGYEQYTRDLWRIVAVDEKSPVGPLYRSEAELLADLERYAWEFGCSATDVS
jgi:hypothetical protein